MLLFLLRLLLNLLVPSGRDGLSLAARADGRVEQVPAEIALRDGWSNRKRPAATRRGAPAPVVRAGDEAPSLTDPAP